MAPVAARELPPTGVLQAWVAKLGLRYQGCLLTIIRGCDTLERDHPCKLLTRALRGLILYSHAADVRESSSFIEYVECDILDGRLLAFALDHDNLPHHFIMHIVHACEILGYHHPDEHYQSACRRFYWTMANKFHMTPETKEELAARLGAEESEFSAKQ